jgi:hypothetical protein
MLLCPSFLTFVELIFLLKNERNLLKLRLAMLYSLKCRNTGGVVTRVEVTRHSRIDPRDYELGLAVGELDMRSLIKVHGKFRSLPQ